MKKFLYALMIGSLLVAPSCTDFVSKDDVSPNNPGNAPLAAQLPVAELALFAMYGGNLSRVSGTYVQHFSGVSNQSLDAAQYLTTEIDVSNDWNTIYSSGLTNTKEIITKAGDANPHYRGIAKILQAMLIGVATDFWGDVPYREAGLGEANLAPKTDTQEQILGDIQTLLDEAIADLKKPVSANTSLPGPNDYIHGGATEPWIQNAYVLKARYAMRLTKRNSTDAATKALAAINSAGDITASNDAFIVYGPNGNENNQYYAFEEQRAGYIRASSVLVDTMNALNDPRRDAYFTTVGGEFVGTGVTNAVDTGSYVGLGFAGISTPIPLITADEALFLKAEAQARLNQFSDAEIALDAAITANITATGGSVGTYLDQLPTLDGNNAIETIMFQKWIANYTKIEAWNDWRRTGVPAFLIPNPDGQIDQIPRRWPTEQRERTSNPNYNPKISDLITPVYWDKAN